MNGTAEPKRGPGRPKSRRSSMVGADAETPSKTIDATTVPKKGPGRPKSRRSSMVDET